MARKNPRIDMMLWFLSIYTKRWYDEFLRGVPPEQTEREADFLARALRRRPCATGACTSTTTTASAFDWRLYEPDELEALSGLELVTACSRSNESQPPSPDMPRYQLVLRRAR